MSCDWSTSCRVQHERPTLRSQESILLGDAVAVTATVLSIVASSVISRAETLVRRCLDGYLPQRHGGWPPHAFAHRGVLLDFRVRAWRPLNFTRANRLPWRPLTIRIPRACAAQVRTDRGRRGEPLIGSSLNHPVVRELRGDHPCARENLPRPLSQRRWACARNVLRA